MSSTASHWVRSLRVAAILLVVWIVAGVVLGILLVEPLNGVRIGGFKLGFWFAQQGSIVAFVLIVLANAIWMDRLEASSRQSEGTDTR